MTEQAEVRLREPEGSDEHTIAELRAVIDSMADAVYIGNEQGITLANQPALDQLGFVSADELNRNIGTLAAEIDTREWDTGLPIPPERLAFARALKGERVVEDVSVRHRLTGEQRVVRCAATRVVIDGRVVAAVAVNTDVTDQKRLETTLRVAEDRQSFLLKLSDTLRPLADPAEIQGAATEALATRLGVTRAYYISFDHKEQVAEVLRDYAAPGSPSLAARHRLGDFATSVAVLATGRPFLSEDVEADSQLPEQERSNTILLSIRSLVVLPLIKSGVLTGTMAAAHNAPRRWSAEEIGLIEEIAERTWAALERAQAEAALRRSEARFRSALETDTVGVIFWGPDVTILDANDAFLSMCGFTREEAVGRSWRDFTPEEFVPASEKVVADLDATGRMTPYEKQYFHKNGGRWWGLFAARRIDDGDIVEYVLDITARKTAEAALLKEREHQQTLLAELQHRVRNTLAVVRSIARRTAENSDNVDDMLAHFEGRLDAFSRAQAALTRNAEVSVDLASLIEDELVAHAAREGPRLHMKGPKVTLAAAAAERLSLAVHELATNAVKHGALSSERGTISIRWRRDRGANGEQLGLLWEEQGVDIAAGDEPSEGFGMELLRRSLPYDLQAETTVELRPNGLRFELSMPLHSGA